MTKIIKDSKFALCSTVLMRALYVFAFLLSISTIKAQQLNGAKKTTEDSTKIELKITYRKILNDNIQNCKKSKLCQRIIDVNSFNKNEEKIVLPDPKDWNVITDETSKFSERWTKVKNVSVYKGINKLLGGGKII